MGGVTINVQVPVSDDRFPSINGGLRRVYIPSGIQHMDGSQALRYARSRHGSSDFDRGARQQRVLLSLREQADPQDLIPRLPELIDALSSAVSTDIPSNQLAPLLGLASQVDTKNIRSYVFAPPFYGVESARNAPVYYIRPNVSKIRAAVRDAFTADPADEALRQTLAQEGGGVWVLNGTADSGRGTRVANYLDYHGLAASAPRGKPAPDDRLPGEDFQGHRHHQGGPRRPDRHHRDRGEGDPGTRRTRRPLRLLRPLRRSPYSIGVSQCVYSGSRPRTASK
jgi:hypothetical protein